MASCRIDIENLNQGMPGPCTPLVEARLQRTMPEQLSAVMSEPTWQSFSAQVNAAIAGPAGSMMRLQKVTGGIFALMIGTFFTAFLSVPLSAITNSAAPMPLFLLPFLVWPPSFIAIFVIGCRTSSIHQGLVNDLRNELDKQSKIIPGITFHLREEQFVTYSGRGHHTHMQHWIEALYAPPGGAIVVPGALVTPSAYALVPGSAVDGSLAGTSASIADRLANLEDLKQRLLISDKEYEYKREELLRMV